MKRILPTNLDRFYEQGASFENVYQGITGYVLTRQPAEMSSMLYRAVRS